jgi:hypothetical protein
LKALKDKALPDGTAISIRHTPLGVVIIPHERFVFGPTTAFDVIYVQCTPRKDLSGIV